jgi:hypothetical protein
MLGHKHRMDQVLGKGHLLKRMVALGTIVIWLAFFVYTLLSSNVSNFSQPSCDNRNKIVRLSYLAPFLLLLGRVDEGDDWLAVLVILPLLAIITAWGIAIHRRRRPLWYIANGTRRTPGFWVVWSVCCRR